MACAVPDRNRTVKLNKIVAQLRREAKANPKKAAVLGLLVVVALCVWAPHLWGRASTDTAADGAAAEASVAQLAPSATTTPAAPPQPNDEHDTNQAHPWDQLVEWLEQDPRTKTADGLTEIVSPFRTIETESAKAAAKRIEQEDESPKKVVTRLTSEDLKEVRFSTLIGPRRRLVLINGKTYRRGETVTLAKDEKNDEKNDETNLEFKLIEIDLRRIVLKRRGKQFELRLPERGGSKRIEHK